MNNTTDKMYTKRICYFEELLGEAIHLSCDHPYISKIEKVWIDRCTLALGMKRIRRTLLNVVCSKQMMYQLAYAVKYLHDNNIVHCDIKTSNILIDDDDNVLLTDFGIATYTGYSRYITWQPGCCHILESDLEIDHIDPAIDIYALGKLFQSNYNKNNLDSFERDTFDDLTSAMLRKDMKERCDIDFVLKHPFFRGEYVSIKGSKVNPYVFNSLADKNRKTTLLYADQMLKSISQEYPNDEVYVLTRELLINSKYSHEAEKGIMNACKMMASQLLDHDSPYDGELGLLHVDRVLNALFQK